MSDYMKEAKRLAVHLTHAAGTGDRDAEASFLAALLAHIQRGAVPEGYVAVPRFLAENHRNLTDVPRYQRILDDCLATVPDYFRGATKMVAAPAECRTCSGHGMVGGLLPNGGGYRADPCPDCTAPAPAEVPVPEPEFVLSYDGWHRRYLLKKMPVGSIQVWGEQAVRTYGAACRAAGEAAGYARGLAEAGRDAERQADAIVREVAELPDRDSPADWPAAMLVTSDELRGIVRAALRGEVKP